mgnify:CR=1 FL=1
MSKKELKYMLLDGILRKEENKYLIKCEVILQHMNEIRYDRLLSSTKGYLREFEAKRKSKSSQ